MKLIASTSEIEDGDYIECKIGDTEILVGKADGRYFALEDICPHAWVKFGFANLHETTLTCPWHGLQFDVHSGECTSWEGMPELTTYPLEIKNGEIYLREQEADKETN